MKRILIGFSAITVLNACNNNTSVENQGSQPAGSGGTGNLITDISGFYNDTLPCADCPGIIAELMIRPDTTFEYRERILTAESRPSKANSMRGVYSFPSEGKIKFTSSGEGNPTRLFTIGDKSVVVSDSEVQAKGGHDLVLEMTEKLVGRKGGEFILHKIKPFSKYPTQVFNFVSGNDIHINKAYLDAASEGEKAIAAFYALQYNSGCDQSSCPLVEAMNMDETALKASVAKWIPDVTLLPRETSDSHLAMLFFVKTPTGLQVNYNIMSPGRQVTTGTDDFTLDGSVYRLNRKTGDVHQVKPAVSNQKKEAPERKRPERKRS